MKLKEFFSKIFFLQLQFTNEKTDKLFLCLECPFCQEKDPNQFIMVGDSNIKCMSCCNFFEKISQ